jgi:MoaA/NifB/PqqE/SkfB family radical SAM enzyme
MRMTARRLWNLHRLHRDYAAGARRVRAKPTKLVLEATNVCNLHCPGCFTGVGENGRIHSAISLDFYRQVLGELGDTLLEIEFYNWGEPFLCKSVPTMIEEAHRKGIRTVICTNFSVPFDEAKAEAVVRAGLSVLSLSIDGAAQENYAKYRRGGDLALVLRNAQMILDAKRRLGSTTPEVIWSYHVFPHNVEEVEAARAKSIEMGFDFFFCSKGFTYGEEWRDTRYDYFLPAYRPIRCNFLWYCAVIHNDGGAAPCCGSFYHEDDLGKMSVAPGQPGAASFAEIWNNQAYQHVRGLFAGEIKSAAASCGGLCDECPQTLTYQGGVQHAASGRDIRTFVPAFTMNDGHKYFYGRKPARDTKKRLKPVRAARAAATGLPEAN